MSNYNENPVSGTSWTRCRTVAVSNPLAGYPDLWGTTTEAIFQEETVMILDGKKVGLSSESCSKVFDPVAGTISMADPSTGVLTGETVSHMRLYEILYSLYLQTAKERDALRTGP